MALAYLPFLLKAEKLDSIAANVFRAWGARPVGGFSARAGRLGHWPLVFILLHPLALWVRFSAVVVVRSFTLWY